MVTNYYHLCFIIVYHLLQQRHPSTRPGNDRTILTMMIPSKSFGQNINQKNNLLSYNEYLFYTYRNTLFLFASRHPPAGSFYVFPIDPAAIGMEAK